MNINYEAYRVFYYTAKTRSFTQAANALGNSQPNITRIIKNLERELGCTLFLRNNRHVELTAEGETLYRHVSAAFEQLQAGEEALLRGGGLDGGILRIAATEIALHVFLLPVLSRFRGRYPGVHIRLFNGSTPAAIDELKEEGINIGMLRPITLWPFPKAPLCEAAKHCDAFLSVEMNMGQMLEDVQLAIGCSRPVYLCNRVGGMIPAPEQVLAKICEIAKMGGAKA